MLKALPAVQLAGGMSHLLCKLRRVPVKSSIFSEIRIFGRLLWVQPMDDKPFQTIHKCPGVKASK